MPTHALFAGRSEVSRSISGYWIDVPSRRAYEHYGSLGAEEPALGFPVPEARSNERTEVAIMSTSQDTKLAIRTLRRRPAFAVTAIVTLALAIGATTAIFSFMKALLLDPLPFPDARSLVIVSKDDPQSGFERLWLPAAEWERWRARSRIFESVTGFAFRDFDLQVDGAAHRIRAARARPDFLRVLGRAPAVGRGFVPSEFESGASPVAILSQALWQERFAGSPDVVGQTIRLDDREIEVVGVLPAEPAIPIYDVDLILPYQLTVRDLENRRSGQFLLGLARLPAGVDSQSAQAELAALLSELQSEQPARGMDDQVPRVETLPERVVGDTRRPIQLLFAAVLAVLLIACANITNLLLTSAHGRRQELAVRFSMGATRWRLLRQLMTESLVLALFGGVLGCALSVVLVRMLVSLAPAELPRLEAIGVDGEVLLFSLALALLTSIVFGLLPAWGASRRPRSTRGGHQTVKGRRFQELLVVGQVALAIVLLIGSGLFVRSLLELLRVEPGFETEGTVWAQVEIPRYRYPDAVAQNQVLHALVEDVAAIPSVRHATATSWTPMSGRVLQMEVEIEGSEIAADDDLSTYRKHVTPGYFEAMGVTLFEGRDFMASDRADLAATPDAGADASSSPASDVSETLADGVAIVNRRMADRFWPDGRAMGARFRTGGDEAPWLKVIAIVGDERQLGLRDEPVPGFYVPYSRYVSQVRSFQLIARGAGTAVGLETLLREKIAESHPFVPIVSARRLQSVVDTQLARPRFLMTVLTMLAGLALSLAAIGLYGVIAYNVAQRTHELGVRSALGANSFSLLWLVTRRGTILVTLGVAIGCLLSLAATRFAQTQLYNISALDPTTFLLVGLGTAAIAMLAVLWPARHAARVDPVKMLREDG